MILEIRLTGYGLEFRDGRSEITVPSFDVIEFADAVCQVAYRRTISDLEDKDEEQKRELEFLDSQVTELEDELRKVTKLKEQLESARSDIMHVVNLLDEKEHLPGHVFALPSGTVIVSGYFRTSAY